MSRHPGIRAEILEDLLLRGESRPPAARLRQEWYWQEAASLQARGVCVADQREGVVRTLKASCPDSRFDILLMQKPVPTAENVLRDLVSALQPLEGDGVSTYPSAWEIDPHGHLDGEEWAGTIRKILADAAPLLAAERVPRTNLPARLRLLVSDWRSRDRGAGGIYRRCADSLEEVMEECGV